MVTNSVVEVRRRSMEWETVGGGSERVREEGEWDSVGWGGVWGGVKTM